MAIVLVTAACLAAVMSDFDLGRWAEYAQESASVFDPNRRVPLRVILLSPWGSGLTTVTLLAMNVEFWSLYPFARTSGSEPRVAHTRFLRNALVATRWMLTNGAAAIVVGLPLLALLASSLLDSSGVYATVGTALLLVLIVTSLVSGSIWERRVAVHRNRRLPSRGVLIFLLSNTISLATVMIVGWHWHAIYDWYEDHAGPVTWEERSWKTSGIDFEPVERADELSVNELAKRVDVRRVELQLPPDDPGACRRAIWDTFANNPHEQSFNLVPLTGSTLRDYWDALSTVLVDRADDLGAPTDSLRVFLEDRGDTKYGYQLPVAAYQARAGDKDVWIILCKWEGGSFESGGPVHASHIHIWAIDAASGQVIAESRCA